MNTRKHSILLLLALAVFCSWLNAQSSTVVPRLVNYSGNAKDALGKPIAGKIPMRRSATGGGGDTPST